MLSRTRLFLKNKSREVVLLHGFYLSYMLILAVASVVDFFSEKYTDAISEVIFLFVCIAVSLYYYRTKQTRLPSLAAIWIAALNLYVLLYSNGFENHVIIFTVLVPLAPFFLLSLKEALFQTFLFYLFLALLMYYTALMHDEHMLLHNSSALINFGYAIFFIISFGFFYHISIENAYRKVKESDQHKEILLNEVHHRVKNNLNMIASMLGLQANMYDDDVKSTLIASKSRIEAIAMVHQMLYQNNNFSEIDFKTYTQQLASLVRSLNRHEKEITLSIESDDILLPLEIMMQLGLIVNELLNNSFKYAFEGRENGEIKLIMKQTGNHYLLIYHDNGKGFEDTQSLLQGRSLGVKLMRLAIKQLNGTMEVANMNGLTYRIEFTHD